MKVVYTPLFLRSFKKLSKDIQEEFKIKESIFRENCFAPGLKTHKLKGRTEWSFTITHKIRVIFIFPNNEPEKMLFINIGDHSIYK